jgi:hypothetical protein
MFSSTGRYPDDISHKIEKEITDFLSDGKIVIHLDSSSCYNGISCFYIVTIIYEDPAPAGIVVRNSPAHIAPRIDPLSDYGREIGYNGLREQCMNCPLHGMFGVPKDEKPQPIKAVCDDCRASRTTTPCLTCRHNIPPDESDIPFK